MQQSTPVNVLEAARKLKNFKINSAQQVILSQFDESFKVIQLPRRVGGTTALLLGGIIRLEYGLDTDILTNKVYPTSFNLANLLEVIGLQADLILDNDFTASYKGHKLRLRTEFDHNYTLIDSPFPPFPIESPGIALDGTGRWNTVNHNFVRIQ